MYRNVIPYTPEILATLVGHQVGTVEKALEIFRKLELIEILDNGAIYMMDIQNFIGKSSTEADLREGVLQPGQKRKSTFGRTGGKYTCSSRDSKHGAEVEKDNQ